MLASIWPTDAHVPIQLSSERDMASTLESQASCSFHYCSAEPLEQSLYVSFPIVVPFTNLIKQPCSQAVVYYNPQYEKLIAECAPNPVPPEARLPMGAWGGPLCAIAFFWFGWTSFPQISYWAPMLAGAVFGLGFTFVIVS